MSSRECSIANALGVVGERWTLLALREVMIGFRRFDQIVRNTGVSRDVLAARLRKLVAAGVLERRRYEDHPPRYEYALTDSGRALQPVLQALMEWGDRFVTPGPPPAVWQHRCGHDLEVRPVCSHCGEEVAFTGVRPRRVGAVR
ncbi:MULTISPECIES: winged helix-turn-helix transcriptional regulator [Actinosynnema]|uniref:Transcriptional regulator n=1 Tax=Actinosynnema pretiosum TaxID=42197 RepID=A0A290Z7Z6_9PSEU|nr:helix-turn-helix domain-containing protein [Actinosynnema pretiosum]ATE55115.1 transcriptional regulator [Actinosynnema pretiosum]